MPGPKPAHLPLNPQLRSSLLAITRSRSARYSTLIRAMTILLVADGVPTASVARRTGQDERTVRKWKRRFAAAPSVETLEDAPRSGRRPKIQMATRLAVVRLACERPEGEKKPKCFRDLWTHQSLADAVERETRVKVSKSEVGRILRFNELRPHVVQVWLRKSDPDFNVKAARVSDLYLNLSKDEVLLSIDEKPLQAIARLYETEVAPDGSLRREFEYVRHGTSALLAAFDVRSGKVIAQVVPHRTAAALVAFVQQIADLPAYKGKTIHIVWDNLNTHHDGPDKRWTEFNKANGGRFRFVFTPKHASWMNQVECWFSILQRRVIRYGNFASKEAMADRVLGYTDHWNAVEAHPFRWTWRSDATQNPRRRLARPERKNAQARP
ncbi:MAG: IS630 family transposase [Deltaproteobacteria bacterium]|nr:IS630 family transposase [Deltaproteobacteria bacterium]